MQLKFEDVLFRWPILVSCQRVASKSSRPSGVDSHSHNATGTCHWFMSFFRKEVFPLWRSSALKACASTHSTMLVFQSSKGRYDVPIRRESRIQRAQRMSQCYIEATRRMFWKCSKTNFSKRLGSTSLETHCIDSTTNCTMCVPQWCNMDVTNWPATEKTEKKWYYRESCTPNIKGMGFHRKFPRCTSVKDFSGRRALMNNE
ncbi:hypothetical protein EDD18DRAFT_62149 [Armillaria luteobubalina]|uniref:Uncharacterized protein n=1 Tax=Armillaria luteobubalina TaxID=153913 RepID=A0AA39QA41_9AGAR|nr:hypothetical protein EDD18DRAFT_62149 [Armillaria luteobubalina]